MSWKQWIEPNDPKDVMCRNFYEMNKKKQGKWSTQIHTIGWHSQLCHFMGSQSNLKSGICFHKHLTLTDESPRKRPKVFPSTQLQLPQTWASVSLLTITLGSCPSFLKRPTSALFHHLSLRRHSGINGIQLLPHTANPHTLLSLWQSLANEISIHRHLS